MAKTQPTQPVDDLSPEDHLTALQAFVDGAREVYYGDYPKLPEGLIWSVDVAGILFLADAEEENYYLNVLLDEKYQQAFQTWDAETLQKFSALVSEQLTMFRGLIGSYEALDTILKARAALAQA